MCSGVSSGAALGVAISSVIGIGTTALALSMLPHLRISGLPSALLVISSDGVDLLSILCRFIRSCWPASILNAIFSALIMFITSFHRWSRFRSFCHDGLGRWGPRWRPPIRRWPRFRLYLLVGLVLLFKQVRVLTFWRWVKSGAVAGDRYERAKRFHLSGVRRC